MCHAPRGRRIRLGGTAVAILFIRCLLLYSLVLAAMKLMGKRQLGQLQPFELASVLIISEMASLSIQSNSVPLLYSVIPIVTIVGASLPGLFAGALITEQLFSIPGIGYASYQSMVSGDIPFSMFYLMFLAVLTLLGNLLADILYAVVDPRVRIS